MIVSEKSTPLQKPTNRKLAPCTDRCRADGRINTAGITLMEPDLECEIAGMVARTTKLVHDGAGNDDLRQAFARLAALKLRRSPIDIYRIECRMNLGAFL